MSANFNNPFAFAPGAAGFSGLPQGFGDEYDPLADPNYFSVDVLGTPIGGSSGGGSGGGTPQQQGPPWWAVLGPGILKDVSSIFAPAPVSIAQAGAQNAALYRSQYPTAPYSSYPAGSINPATGQPYTSSTGIGIGIDANGIRLSDGSHISWILIGGIVLAIALVQSKGFQRR